jgi:predicted RND superfamily exporter protein
MRSGASNGALRRYADLVVRRPWSVLLVSLIATAAVASGIARLAVELDPERSLPADDPYVTVDRRVRKEFGGRNFVAIALVPRTGAVWQLPVLHAVHALTLELLDAPGVIRQNVVSLASPYVRVPADRDGVLTADYLMREPPEDEAGIRSLRAVYESEPLVKGTVVSQDERAALVLVDFYDGTDVAQIAATVEDAVGRYRAPELEIALTGLPILGSFERTLVGQQGHYFLATLAAIVLLLYAAFGHVQGVVLPIATALLSAVWAMGFMGFAGIVLNAWTTAVPVVVVSVAAGHSAQMLKRYYEEHDRLRDRQAALIEATRRIGPVMIAAGATAGIGFAALAILGIPTLAGLGLGAAAGIFAAVVLELTFMLALRALWPVGGGTHAGAILSRLSARVLAALGAALAHRPRAVIGCFLAVAALGIAGYPRLSTETNVLRYWPEETSVGRDLRVFAAHFPSTTTISVLLEGEAGAMQTPEAIQLMTGIQEAMAADPDVGRTASVADIIRRTHEVFVPEQASSGLPADRKTIAQLFYLASSPAFERFVNRSYSRAVVFGYLDRDDSGVTRRVMGRLERYLAGTGPGTIRVSLAGGGGPLLLALNDHVVMGKVLNIAAVFGVIFLIASLILRSFAAGAYVVTPLVMALLVDLAIFAWLDVAFDLAGSSIAAMGVGIGADYAIYFLYRFREEVGRTRDAAGALQATLASSGQAIFFVALAIGAGFAVYAVSDYHPLKIAGVLMPVTMAVNALTTVALVGALVVLRRPRFIFGAPGHRAGGEAVLRRVA